MRKNGQITIFLSLILVCICSLICGLLESARTAGARCLLQIAANSSIDSVFSQYHKQLWNSYRIFLLEFDVEDEIVKTFEEYLNNYAKTENWYPMKVEKAEVKEVLLPVDHGGTYFMQEVLDFMKYGIWDLDLDKNHTEELFKNLIEAVTVNTAAKSYGGYTKDALKLEELIHEISQSLDIQTQYFQMAMNSLEQEEGQSFRKNVVKLKKEINKFLKLVQSYEKKADKFYENLTNSKKEYEELRKDLSTEVYHIFIEEISGYEEYVAQDGMRRKEIAVLVQISEENLLLAEDAAKESVYIEELIDDWEDSEDSEPFDESELWKSVIDIFNAYEVLHLSISTGVKDTQKQGYLEQVNSMGDTGLLSLVLPAGMEISSGFLTPDEFPSKVYSKSKENKPEVTDLINQILINEYCAQFFSDFLSPEKKEVQYEIEYLIGGEDTDRANLKAAVNDILMLREGMNLIHILTNTEKREEARGLASVIVGATGMLPLVSIVTFFIMGVWALGEAITDVKALLAGEKVPFIKKPDDWNLSLKNLLFMGESGNCINTDGEKDGMDYGKYLSIILFLRNPEEKYYRMMDVIQMNIRRNQPDFLMDHCAYSVDMEAALGGKHMFFSLGMLKTQTKDLSYEYEMKVKAKKAY